MTQLVVVKIPTAEEGITKAAAARRARGRQAESMKEGGGERERAVERHRMAAPINCIGRLHALSLSLPISSRSPVCWREI